MSEMVGWNLAEMPRQDHRLALVTGTGGLGYETALALAGASAAVIIAGRNAGKGEEALRRIRATHPNAEVSFEEVNLANLDSIATFAARFADRYGRLDLLINNAGVMAPPTRQETVDGFELQFGTNYLGHFALTGHLLPLLRQGSTARIVQVSSGYHHTGRLQFDDLQWRRRRYRPTSAYAQSKLAMLIFALELQRRIDATDCRLMSNAVHPGYARTDLIANGPGTETLLSRLSILLQPLMSQSAAAGALPTLYAATAQQAIGGGYYGPTGFFELVGPPGPARIAKRALNLDVATQLWDVSERLTGVTIALR